jgi:hypothetical protein
MQERSRAGGRERGGYQHVTVELVVAVMLLGQRLESGQIRLEGREVPAGSRHSGMVMNEIEHRPAQKR